MGSLDAVLDLPDCVRVLQTDFLYFTATRQTIEIFSQTSPLAQIYSKEL